MSALDVHVGRTLLEEGIVKWLLGHKKTVILVTHQLQYLNRADLVSVLIKGHIAPFSAFLCFERRVAFAGSCGFTRAVIQPFKFV